MLAEINVIANFLILQFQNVGVRYPKSASNHIWSLFGS
jgi:hypothetical protein